MVCKRRQVAAVNPDAEQAFAVLVFELFSEQTSSTIIVFVTLTCAWVIFKHRTNITRLRDGTEGRISSGNEKSQDATPGPDQQE